ncbi:MAG: MerR family transcriptional regulator [Polyangiales bacterium]
MARVTGSTVRTVRFYEEAGLLEASVKTCGGHRMFEQNALARLQFILDMRESGLSLENIKRLFELKAAAGTAPAAGEEMSTMLLNQIEQLQNKITKLERLRSELGRMVESIRDCKTCDEPKFPSACGDCSVMKQCGLPRVMKVLWK